MSQIADAVSSGQYAKQITEYRGVPSTYLMIDTEAQGRPQKSGRVFARGFTRSTTGSYPLQRGHTVGPGNSMFPGPGFTRRPNLRADSELQNMALIRVANHTGQAKHVALSD